MDKLTPEIKPDKADASTFWIPIINSYLKDLTALPLFMGLVEHDFYDICQQFNIFVPQDYQHNSSKRLLISELTSLRMTEQHDLVSLLNQYSSEHLYVEQMSAVISAACMGTQHLWKDLGMPERPLLTQLFNYFYPDLKKMNNRNMRWKRFLYRQLCSSGGDYICRAPSCDTCTSFNECFADESD